MGRCLDGRLLRCRRHVISAGDSDSLQTRLGLAAERSWATFIGADARIYGIGNLTRELRGNTRVLVDTIALDSSAPDWTAEIGLGGAYDWDTGGQRASLFSEVTASRAISGGELTSLSGTVGLRVTW